MLRRLAPWSIVVLAALATAPPADACLHAAGAGPTDEPITQRGQQAIVLHDGRVEDLILRVEYFGVDAPALAWVVPVPHAPTTYEAMDPKLFDDVGDWVNLHRQPMFAARARDGGDSPDAPPPALVTLLPPAKVGPFRIQPIQTDAGSTGGGEAAAAALNAWMKANDFAEIPAEGLRYYVERDWTFLAIEIDPAEGAAKVADEGGLPPLRVTFPSETAVYPLKLSTHMGEFTARVYMVTDEAVPTADLAGLRSRGFEAVADGTYVEAPRFAMADLEADVGDFRPLEAPTSLQPLLAARFADADRLHMTVMFSERVNADDPTKFTAAAGSFRPADWDEDLSVPPLAPPAGKPAGTPADAKADTPEAPKPTDAKAPTPARPESERDDPTRGAGPEKPTKDDKGCACATTPRDDAPAYVALLALVVAIRRRRDA